MDDQPPAHGLARSPSRPAWPPAGLSDARCRLLLLGLLGLGIGFHCVYLLARPSIGLSGDEAHYWDWSRRLDWSYYSKGPAVAVIIRASTAIFGGTMFGVRFPALLLAAANLLCTYWLTRRMFQSHATALLAVVLCHLVPMFVAGSMLMTIDPPYYLCWGLATCFGYLAAVEGKRRAWPAAGAFAGLGFLAKYAALLWLVCLLIYLIAYRPARRLLKTSGPWVAIVVALLFTIPVIGWNAQHDWVTFGHVARSTSEDHAHFSLGAILTNVGELIGGQIGLLNPIIAGLMIAAIVRAARSIRSKDDSIDPLRRAGLAYLLATSLPFFGFVLLVTLRKNAEPNWPVATYFSLLPLTAWLIAQTWPRCRGWLIAASVIGVLAIGAVHYSGMAYPFIHLPPRQWDPASRLRGGQIIGDAVTHELKSMTPGTFILADKYQAASLAAFYVAGQPKTYCIGPYIQDLKDRDRLSEFNIWPDRDLSQPSLRGRAAIFVGHPPADLRQVFDRVEDLPDLPIVYNGVTIRVQKLFRCYGFKGMTLPTDGLTPR